MQQNNETDPHVPQDCIAVRKRSKIDGQREFGDRVAEELVEDPAVEHIIETLTRARAYIFVWCNCNMIAGFVVHSTKLFRRSPFVGKVPRRVVEGG